jgi:hypothetical protein
MAIRGRWQTRVQQLGEYLAGRGREHGPGVRSGNQSPRSSWVEADAEVRSLGWETVRTGFGGSAFGSEVGDAFGAFGIDEGFEMGGSLRGSWGQEDAEG